MKHAGMVVHSTEPYNAESPTGPLAEHALTPTDVFYVRNHGPVPPAEPASFRLRVDGLVDRELSLSLEQLRVFPEHDVVATLQCAGNRRAGLIAVRDIPGEAPWGPGATGTARWTGIRLRDLLAAAGPLPEATDVAFIGRDVSDEISPAQPFAGSIPLRKALGEEVLLAWGMDGDELPPEHGAPLRVVVPGHIGARSVKWLDRIELRCTPSEGHFQHVAYRLLRPDGAPGPGLGMALGEVALNADVLVPPSGSEVPAGDVPLRGYAFAGGDRYVARVDVSADGGRSWAAAELGEDLGRWAWRHWTASLDLPPGEHEVCVRAWDSAAATQPEDPAALWNPKGYVNNAWGRVRLRTV